MKTAVKIILVIYMILAAKLFTAEYYYQNNSIQKAYKLQKTNARYLNAMGKYYENKAAQRDITIQQIRENLNISERYRRTAIKQSPAEGTYYASYGWLLGNLGRESDAHTYFQKALTLNPHSRRIPKLYEQYRERRE